MNSSVIAVALAIFMGSFGCTATANAEDPKAPKEAPLYDISMEVQSLRAFNTFGLADEQLKLIAKFAKETAEPLMMRKPPRASDEIRKVLTDLRDALLDGNDDKVERLEENLDEITDKEKPELEDSFSITPAARTRAAEVLKSLSVNTLASYYDSVKEEVLDPVPYLTDALEQVRELNKDEWRDKREEITEALGWAVAGADADAAKKLSDKIVALLRKGRVMTDEEFKEKKSELEKEAAALVGDVGADNLLRNHALHGIAEMLSNPRLEATIKMRLK